MIRNFIVLAYRNIFRHFSVSVMNIAGLAFGLACTFMIFLWVVDELSYDRFLKDSGQIYRVEEDQHYSNGIYHVQVTPWPSGPIWQEKIPEIRQACRITSPGSFLITQGDRSFYEGNGAAVDSTFFSLFSFPLLTGNPKTVLTNPGSMVISKDLADKYFGNDNALGKTLMVNNHEVFQITGIMKTMPANSSFKMDFLIPFDYMKQTPYYSTSWDNNSINTYVKLNPGSDTTHVNNLLTKVATDNRQENTTRFVLFPFTAIHLHSYGGYGHKPGAILNIWIFSSIALLVLIIACINFMNLSTAQSSVRSKEIGLRKVNGADRKSLLFQFFGESMTHAFLAMILAVLLILLLLGPFDSISGKDFQFRNLLTPVFIAGLFGITFLTGIFAGLYPAVVLSSFKPVHTLKGGQSRNISGGMFRKVSVAFQFVLSIGLIAGTLVIYSQLKHMQLQKLGYDKENLLYIPLRGELQKSYPHLKEELLHEPEVKFISAGNNPPQFIGSNSDNAYWEGKPAGMDILISMAGVDYDYVKTMGIQMKSGRSFSRDFPGDQVHDSTANFLINEQMEKVMGIKDAVGAHLKFGPSGTIVGVMKDYNFSSLHYPIEPLVLSMWGKDYLFFMYIRLNPGDLTRSMKQLEKAWKKIMPTYPFDYHFVDEQLDKNYQTEVRMGTLARYFALLAVLIGCIGLFGLSAFMMERKIREVGIRKALGAGSSNLLFMFTGEFIVLLVIASLISIPITWYALWKFLQNYAYRIHLNIWIFLLAAMMTLIVALIAMSYQTVRAIRTNPAETLKYE